MEEYDVQVDFHAAIMVSKDNLEEELASTPTMSCFMKEKKAELYFSTGESTTNPAEPSTTPRQRSNMPGMESLSSSHQKTPKLSNMRHLLGSLAEDLASPSVLQGPTPQQPERPSNRNIMNDTSSSSSNNADSKNVSGDPSGSSLEMVDEKLEYTATATSAKKPQMGKTPGTEQTLAVKHLLGRDQENKNALHAITRLREYPKRQQSFEFPTLGNQRAPGSGGVIWNLDTPVEGSDPQQLQTANMPSPHVNIPPCSGGMPPACSGLHADPWSTAMSSQSLPTASPYASTFSHWYGDPMQSSLQPQTAEQFQGATTGVFMGSCAFAPGTEYFQSHSQPQDAVPAHHSPFNLPQSCMQDKRFFYQPSHDVHMMHPPYVPTSMVENNSFWRDMPSQQHLMPSSFAGAGYVPVMRGGMPYTRNGRPVRIPLEDNTNYYEGEDIKKIATMCHIQASKQKQVPAKANKQAVKKLVQQQIEEEKPIRAPWYRDGPRPPRQNLDGTWRKQEYSRQQPAVQSNKGWRKEFKGSDRAEITLGQRPAECTGSLIPAVGHKGPMPTGGDSWTPRKAEGSSAGLKKQQAQAASIMPAAAPQEPAAPVVIEVAGGRGMAVGTGCFIPSV
ncbi:hypothetical protein COCOBI_04-0580 [Coccomyxa sp. Obi]|nr:hypothetical protein COCOBI_04-0580 [Coccomyxa sp. Obi]